MVDMSVVPSPLLFPDNIEIIPVALWREVGLINHLNGPGPFVEAGELWNPIEREHFLVILNKLTPQATSLGVIYFLEAGRTAALLLGMGCGGFVYLASGQWVAFLGVRPCAGTLRGVTPRSCSLEVFWWGTDKQDSHICGPGSQMGGQRAVEGADDSVGGLCGGVPCREGPEGQMAVLLALKGPKGCHSRQEKCHVQKSPHGRCTTVIY